jgi:hypothetical protein
MLTHHISTVVLPLLYLDPGSGSLLVQILLAALLGIGILVRVFWGKISTFFGLKKSETEGTADEEDHE